MHPIFQIRQEFGGTYATVFEDGIVIPWKLLSLKDYLQLSKDRDRGLIPLPILEDEIFKKCVLDQSYIRQLSYLSAGIVATVVSNIWLFSGPTDINSFNQSLNYTRHLLHSDDNSIFHDLVQIITIAFPYKPEEVYAMDYDTFLFRLAQSEKKLLNMGAYLQEPIQLMSKEEENVKKPEPIPEKPKLNLKEIWEKNKQQERKLQNKSRQTEDTSNIDRKKWWKVSPILEAKQKHNINFKQESREQEVFGLEGHDKLDREINKIQFQKRMQEVYADVLKELAKKG